MADKKMDKKNVQSGALDRAETDTEKHVNASDYLAESDPLAELTDLLKRTQANFENYRKQTERRVEEIKLMAARDVLQQLLPVVDGFELAFKDTKNKEEFVKGMEMLQEQLHTLLEKNALTPIVSVGMKFDPYQHEALMRVESEQPEGMIIEEFQRGYMLHGQVIRHALVKISAGKSAVASSTDVNTKQDNTENHTTKNKTTI